MIDLSNAILRQVSVHYVGNKNTGGDFIRSRKSLALSEDDRLKMKNSFLGKFNLESDRFSFAHPSSLNFNEVYKYCLETFAEEPTFHANSVHIGKHLFESATHPKIKAGELYICYYDNCEVGGVQHNAIGIYKTENKNNFLDLDITDKDCSLIIRQGVDLSGFDKACLVLQSNAENGFDILVYDNNSKGDETIYWRETFLGILPQANEYYQTNQVLSIAKNFIARQLPEEYDIAKTDQIDLLNKSVEYFRANESFDKKKFEKEVFDDAGMIKAYRKFEQNYLDSNDIELADQFDISTAAVKKQARVFKSVLKLDKNFHVYIHGDKSLIEKGYDAHLGKSYYKIYFDEEN